MKTDKERVQDILDICRCSDDYKLRKLTDPYCASCNYSEEFLSAMKEAREEYAKEFAKWTMKMFVYNIIGKCWISKDYEVYTDAQIIEMFNAHLAAEAEKERGKG